MEGQLQMVLIAVGVLLVLGVAAVVVLMVKRTAYLGPVKEELQKEKAWLRRGEYNAAMVKGRQNLELLLKLVAEKNGIQLDNTAKAQANAREMEERQSQNPRGGRKAKTKSVMTHKEFNRWLTENGYLDRVARWEMHQVRQIGNKAVHENYSDKEDAWNQFNYLEDILKVITEKSQSPSKRTERSAERRAEAVPKKQAPKAKQEPAKKKEAPKPKQEPAKKKEAPKAKQEPAKKKEAPKPKQEPVKKQPEAAGSEQVSAEPAKKKHRRRRPKKKHTAENAAAEGKQATKEKQEQPKKEAPKPKQEQPASEQPKPKKKNNHNQYWRKRRKKKSSGQANANANANASAATAGSGGQE